MANEKIVVRSPNTSTTYSLSDMNNTVLAKKYENMLNSVTKMIESDGFTYSVWIYFQIGTKDSALTFNSASTDKKQNLIASLDVEKSGSGIANQFTLVIQYDPFNYGQETTDQIDKLETFIANAMAEDFDSSSTACRGKIQYGYNSTSDSNLVSPLYEFYLTSASTDVRFDSGIVTYTFTGVSTIASDCDYTATFPAFENKKLLQVVGETLYTYYGDPENKPSFIANDSGIEVVDNDFKYMIDIPQTLLDDSPTISYQEVTSDTMSPIVYCKQLLDLEHRTQSEIDSGLYDNLDEKSVNLQPRWVLSVTDVADAKTIHIAHLKPKSTKNASGEEVTEKSDENTISINYAFTWGSRDNNGDIIKSIVVGWNPEVDLYTYLIRKSLVKRLTRLKDLSLDASISEEVRKEYRTKYAKVAFDMEDTFREMYNAEIELVGIPADPPLTAEIQVLPRILETESRTSGIYAITGASDKISTSGVFTSSLKLFRLRSIDGVKELNVEKLIAETTSVTGGKYNKDGTYTSYSWAVRQARSEASDNSNGGTDSFGGRWRIFCWWWRTAEAVVGGSGR